MAIRKPLVSIAGRLKELPAADSIAAAWASITGKPSVIGAGADQASARAALGLGSAAVAPILGTVSQAAGVPTGAIIQRGSNANGTFIRFADGTQICTYLRAGSNTTIAAYAYATMSDWTYPAAFVAAGDLVIQSSYHGYGTGFFIVGISGIAATGTTGGMYLCNARNVASLDGGFVYFTAVGRWF